MTEHEKMRAGELYDCTNAEGLEICTRARKLCGQLQSMEPTDVRYRVLIEKLIPGIPASSAIAPPFHCDFGDGITIGENTFVNYNCTMLDGGRIKIKG